MPIDYDNFLSADHPISLQAGELASRCAALSLLLAEGVPVGVVIAKAYEMRRFIDAAFHTIKATGADEALMFRPLLVGEVDIEDLAEIRPPSDEDLHRWLDEESP